METWRGRKKSAWCERYCIVSITWVSFLGLPDSAWIDAWTLAAMLTRPQFDRACKLLIEEHATCSPSLPINSMREWCWNEHPVHSLLWSLPFLFSKACSRSLAWATCLGPPIILGKLQIPLIPMKSMKRLLQILVKSSHPSNLSSSLLLSRFLAFISQCTIPVRYLLFCRVSQSLW